MIKAVIFDRDGVLLDSEYTNVRSGELAFKELGVTLTDAEKKSIVGRHPEEYAQPILTKHNLDYDKLEELLDDRYYELLESTPIFEETIQLVKDIYARGIALALCTSSEKASTIKLLERMGIQDLFKVIVTHEDCSKHKPDPAPYLVTAQKLGVAPQDCLVIEDSEVGLQAALGAGMKCVIIYNTYTKGHDFSGAQQVVDSAGKLDVSEIITYPSSKSTK